MNAEKVTGKPITIGDTTILPGERRVVDLPITMLYTHTPVTLPVQVINGRKAGPRLFISAAVHGDELNGVEVARRLLTRSILRNIRGTLIVLPVVNVFGFIQHSRYLPDRRDLNRSFPGSKRGSLAARLAHIVVEEIISQCTHGIDMHTGAVHRSNLPQIRANLNDEETLKLAKAFGVPVLLNSDLRDGSLREVANEYGVKILLYEAGEALRLDELSIRAGVRGIIRVMRSLGMLAARKSSGMVSEPYVANNSAWERASASGIMRSYARLGAYVKRGELLGAISDPSDLFEHTEYEVRAQVPGLIIGKSNIPLVNEGDAVFHIARFDDVKEAAASVEAFQAQADVDAGGMPEP